MNDVRLDMVSPEDPNIKLGRVTTTLSSPDKRLGDDPKKPDFESDFHHAQMRRWFMLDALWDGTEGMRRAGKVLLPRYDQEHQDTWQKRLDNAVLLNYFRKTVQGYVGKPFGKPLQVPDDMPENITSSLKDIDNNGTTFDLFAQQAFEKAMCKGIVHALIDFPPSNEGDTAEDEASRDPVIVIIQPENLIGARCDSDGCLTQVRILEQTLEPDGAFGETMVKRIRVLEPTKWTLYRQEKKRWVVEDKGINSLGEIPLVTFYTDREGFMRSRPPLLDLAYKNVEHWVSSSDQRNILTIARFPILIGSGVNPSDPLTLGPNSYFGFRDPAAVLRYVEHGGAAIGSGRQDMEDLKSEMSILGLTLLMPQQTGSLTATAKAIDGAESITELQRIVMSFEVFLNQVVFYVARWLGYSDDEAKALPEIRVNGDYAKTLNVDAGIQLLMNARGNKDISRSAYINELKRRSVLPQDFDADDDAELIDDEKKKSGDGMPPIKGQLPIGVIKPKNPIEQPEPPVKA